MKVTEWTAFFSGLAMAEKAAADHCLFIAETFKNQNEHELAEEYFSFAKEEMGHHQLVADLIRGPIDITPRARDIYEGRLFQSQTCVLERLAIVHLAFEPSALAFLGHLYGHAQDYFHDPVEAEKIRQSFGIILREEVQHILNGKELITRLLRSADEKTKKNLRKSLRLHKAFLSLGLKSFFKDRGGSMNFIDDMLANYDLRFENLAREIA